MTSPSARPPISSPVPTTAQSTQKFQCSAPKMLLSTKSTGCPPKAAVEGWVRRPTKPYEEPRERANHSAITQQPHHDPENQPANHSPGDHPPNLNQGTQPADNVGERRISLSSLTGVLRASTAAAQSWWAWYRDSKTHRYVVLYRPTRAVQGKLTRSRTVPVTAVKRSKIDERIFALQRFSDPTHPCQKQLSPWLAKQNGGVAQQTRSPDPYLPFKDATVTKISRLKQPLVGARGPKLPCPIRSGSPRVKSAVHTPTVEAKSLKNARGATTMVQDQLKGARPSSEQEFEKNRLSNKGRHDQKHSSRWPDDVEQPTRAASPSHRISGRKLVESPHNRDSLSKRNGLFRRLFAAGSKGNAGKELDNPKPMKKGTTFGADCCTTLGKKLLPKSQDSNQIKKYRQVSRSIEKSAGLPAEGCCHKNPSRSPIFNEINLNLTKESHRVSRKSRQSTGKKSIGNPPNTAMPSLSEAVEALTANLKKDVSKPKMEKTDWPCQAGPPVPNKSETKRKRLGSRNPEKATSTSPKYNKVPATKDSQAAIKCSQGPKEEKCSKAAVSALSLPFAERHRSSDKIHAMAAKSQFQKSIHPSDATGGETTGRTEAKSSNHKDKVVDKSVEYSNLYIKTTNIAGKSSKPISSRAKTTDGRSKSLRPDGNYAKAMDVDSRSTGFRSLRTRNTDTQAPKSLKSSLFTKTTTPKEKRSLTSKRYSLFPPEDMTSGQRHKSIGPDSKTGRRQRLIKKRSSSFPAGLFRQTGSKDNAHGTFEGLLKETKREIIESMVFGGRFDRGIEHAMLA